MVSVELDLRASHQHLVGVSLRFEPRLAVCRMQLPAWTPGSYLIRDYVRQLESLEVSQQGLQRPLRRLGPACWQVELDPAGGLVQVGYRVMATELSVRTCHLDSEHGFLALAAVVLEIEGERWSPHRLQLQLPSDWRAFVPLPELSPACWWARDLDQLLDSPLEAGPHQERRFSVAGVPHRWVCWAGPVGSDQWLWQRFPQLLHDVEQVCLACCRLMGVAQPAAQHYLFVLHLVDEGYGGLEHDDSQVLVYGRRALLQPDGYRKLLQLVAHEYLHQWNVRRLRPAELTPIDYHQPSVVPTLWFAEGITSYLDQLLPLAAGLTSVESVLDDLGADLSRYRLTPGRAVQSLRCSSEEAWVKLYKADAYAPDSQVSYYLKGAVVALCLDLHLRRQGSSLGVVLRQLWASHGCWGRGYREADLIDAFAAEAPDLSELLPQWLRSVEDPDLDGYLQDVGLRLEPVLSEFPSTGMTLRRSAGGDLLVQRVVRGAPAEAAGVMVGDVLIGLDGEWIREPDQVQQLLQVGCPQPLLIARRSQLRTLSLCCAAPQPERYRLIRHPEATAAQLSRQTRWLHLDPSPC